MDSSPEQTPAEQVKAHLHAAFDSQIPNFASYNLVAAPGNAGASGLKVIGYRQQPAELVIAPVHPVTLTASESAITINNTNVNQLALLSDGAFEITLSTGRMLRFSVPPYPSIDFQADDAVSVSAVIDQEIDAHDFAEFMERFMDAIEGTEDFV